MSNEPQNRMMVVVRTDVPVDMGQGRRQEHPFQHVDELQLGQPVEECLAIRCGPWEEVFVLRHVVCWSSRGQTPEEARVVPPWERVEGTKGAAS